MALESHSRLISTGELERKAVGMSGEDGDIFEQRRVRRISSILLRNVTVPIISTASKGAAITSIHRPRPRRSISTASTSSAGTIRRVPSNKSLRNKVRGRASSIASINPASGDIDVNPFLYSDLSALRHAIDARLCQTFVTLSRSRDGVEVSRTCTSGRAGVNFEWGKTPGSRHDPDGLPLGLLGHGMSAEESVKVTVWYKVENITDKGKARDLDPIFVDPGMESVLGWSVLLNQDVHLKRLAKMSEDPATSALEYGDNTLILGLTFPLAQVQPITKEKGEDLEHGKGNGSQERRKVGSGGRKGDQVYYYLASNQMPAGHSLRDTPTTQTEADQRAVIRAKLKDGDMVRGYEVEGILRLLQLQRELYLTALDISDAGLKSDKILESLQGPVAKDLLCAEKEERLAILRNERDGLQENIKMKRKLIQERTEGLNRRRARLEIARRSMAKEKASYNDLQVKLSLLNRQCASIRSEAYARRVHLLQQLEYIYPVELVDGATLLFSIVGAPLANRVVEEEGGKLSEKDDDDVVSSALGLISQVVVLMSVYLDTPIHYPISTAGSRSIIQDSISVMSGPRAFPLYSKGVESYRFEYGIFLLNKNIEQLMNHFGITILDIRNTLPNLKNLLVTLSASSEPRSRLSRKNLIGNETISLKMDRSSPSTLTTNSTPQSSQPPKEERKPKGGSGWGMSLLGWGSVKESNSESSLLPTASSSPLPTVRTLGSTR